jgi:hypothetical protein
MFVTSPGVHKDTACSTDCVQRGLSIAIGSAAATAIRCFAKVAEEVNKVTRGVVIHYDVSPGWPAESDRVAIGDGEELESLAWRYSTEIHALPRAPEEYDIVQRLRLLPCRSRQAEVYRDSAALPIRAGVPCILH